MHAKVKSSLLHLADMQTRSQSHAYDTHTYERGVFFHGLVHDASHLRPSHLAPLTPLRYYYQVQAPGHTPPPTNRGQRVAGMHIYK
jgi:hypothetical protein